MQNRAAIPVNTLIAIIIGIILLSLGIIFFKNIIHQGGVRIEEIDQAMQEKIRTILIANTEPVVIYPSSLTLGAGDQEVIGIGIKNFDEENHDLRIKSSCDEGVEVEILRNKITLKPGGVEIVKILITASPGIERGSYTCIISVKDKDEKEYGNPQLLTINVIG
ncbi:hypothetical protein J7K74_01880 [Candidatus Woesearchaeota archaeon]|nr:hypothetical protein [Candidatus Woesearchaeota archaeon]